MEPQKQRCLTEAVEAIGLDDYPDFVKLLVDIAVWCTAQHMRDIGKKHCERRLKEAKEQIAIDAVMVILVSSGIHIAGDEYREPEGRLQ